MSAMGLGTYFSRFIRKNLLLKFILIEGILGIVGGLSVPILYGAYAAEISYYPVMVLFIILIGILIGLEIPLLTRIMVKYYSLRQNISNILSLDYLGALFASLLFPFLLLPVFGLFQSSIVAGGLNVLVAAFALYFFRDYISNKHLKSLQIIIIAVIAILAGFFLAENKLMNAWESALYDDRVILSKQTKYQKIVVTKDKKDIRLFLDGNLQFSSIDEYRYHEALVHVPMTLGSQRKSVLILGGGDGLAVREVLKYPEVEKITLVDLDPEVTRLAIKHPLFLEVNGQSLLNSKVQVIHEDAFTFLNESNEYFDVILGDLPDPRNVSLSRLYSREFFKTVRKRLSKQGVFVTQATSPFFAKKAFWCIVESVRSADFKHVKPYHVYVPSFGDWGFVLASSIKLEEDRKLSVKTRFLDANIFQTVFNFSKDLIEKDIEFSALNDPKIFRYYLQGWQNWF